MNNEPDFEPGDWVAVVGGTLTKNNGVESIEPSIKVGKVLHVGKWDMVLEDTSWSFPSTFIAKISRCSHVKVKPEFAIPTEPEPAELGDMVLHLKGIKVGKEDQSHVGLLMEVSQTPGSRAKGKIAVADKLIDVELADVIVLQRKDEKS